MYLGNDLPKVFVVGKSLMMFSLFYNENVYFHNAKAGLECFLFNVNFTFYEAFGAGFCYCKNLIRKCCLVYCANDQVAIYGNFPVFSNFKFYNYNLDFIQKYILVSLQDIQPIRIGISPLS